MADCEAVILRNAMSNRLINLTLYMLLIFILFINELLMLAPSEVEAHVQIDVSEDIVRTEVRSAVVISMEYGAQTGIPATVVIH